MKMASWETLSFTIVYWVWILSSVALSASLGLPMLPARPIHDEYFYMDQLMVIFVFIPSMMVLLASSGSVLNDFISKISISKVFLFGNLFSMIFSFITLYPFLAFPRNFVAVAIGLAIFNLHLGISCMLKTAARYSSKTG